MSEREKPLSVQALDSLRWRRENPDLWSAWYRSYRAELFARLFGPVA